MAVSHSASLRDGIDNIPKEGPRIRKSKEEDPSNLKQRRFRHLLKSRLIS